MIAKSECWRIYVCEVCRKEFQRPRSQTNVRYCSRLCQNNSPDMKRHSFINGRNNKNKLSDVKNPNWRGGPEYFECINCKRIFPVSIHELKSQKRKGFFCSKKCFEEFKQKNKMSEEQIRLNKNMARRIRNAIIKNSDIDLSDLLGYSLQELKSHLENLFEENMSWSNYGEWQIDHIVPVSSFRFNSYGEFEFKECWKLSNLQPLWGKENLKKGYSPWSIWE